MSQSGELQGMQSRERNNGNGHGMQDDIAEKTQAAVEQAKELGTEALEEVDKWLEPVGLSLREKPVTTLAILGGVAMVVGAAWMSATRQRSRTQAMMDQVSDYVRRSRWS